MDFILSDYNVPFMAALLIVMFISLLEGVGALIGINSSSLLDRINGDYSFDSSASIEMNHHHAPTIFEYVSLGIRVPKIPLLIMMLIFLFLFGSVGLLLQSLSVAYLGKMQSYVWSVSLTFITAFPLSLIISHVIAYFIPNDSSSAVSWDSLVGKVAEVTLGKAKKGFPTRAKCTDSLGKMHHFLVEPEDPQETFTYGEKVLLVRCVKGRFYALRTISNTKN